jgi:rare lipoprotein A (peptidoglycan hydrolase)
LAAATADLPEVPPVRRAALAAALVAALLGVPSAGSAEEAEDLPALEARLAEATARTDTLSTALERAAAQDGGLRVALERLADEHDRAQARLDARVREVWITRRPDPLGGWVDGLAAPALRRVAHAGAAAAVRSERELVEAVSAQSASARALREQAAAFRAGVQEQAQAALAAQEQARVLLARAEAALAAQQVAAVAQAERARLEAEASRLGEVRAALDAASATVTRALTPAQTRRMQRARAQQAPLVALVEASGAGYPGGYAPTGQVLRGPASWYGPGFVGSPTASGWPYDPERLTCAHRTLPLGTLVRVSANRRSVSCLVNDRGPYVPPRILDLSRAGSRALGFDGVQDVVIEVLARG